METSGPLPAAMKAEEPPFTLGVPVADGDRGSGDGMAVTAGSTSHPVSAPELLRSARPSPLCVLVSLQVHRSPPSATCNPYIGAMMLPLLWPCSSRPRGAGFLIPLLRLFLQLILPLTMGKLSCKAGTTTGLALPGSSGKGA